MVRFIVLALYNDTELYNSFKRDNTAYLDAFEQRRPAMASNIRFYYVSFVSNDAAAAAGITDDEVIVDETNRHITMRGTESWCPGLLTKTMRALAHVNDATKYNFRYDYVIRTNASSFINLEGFYNELAAFDAAHDRTNAAYKYVTMGSEYKVTSKNESYGLNDQTMQVYSGTTFLHGVCIVMNAELVSLLCANDKPAAARINYSVVDDVELGRVFEALSLSHTVCPHGIFKHNLKGRILFMDHAHDPLVYCNNRFKHDRSIDLRNFTEVSTRFIRALVG
jgi:hypothetical protein